MRIALLLATIVVADLVGPSPSMASNAAPQDSVTADVASLRGTSEPLPRGANALQWGGRAVLFPFYASTRALTWPAERGAVYYDEHGWVRNVAGVLGSGIRVAGVDVAAFANYQTGEAFAELGLELTRRDWLDEGGRARLKAGWLDEDRNVFDLRLRTPPKRRVDLQVRALLDNKAERRFHGLGPGSDDEGAIFDRRRLLIEASVGTHASDLLTARLTGYLRDLDLSRSEDLDAEDPTVESQFPELWARSVQSDYMGVEGALAFDTRDDGIRSTRGGLVRVRYGLNVSRTESDSDYTHGSFEVQRFFDLYRGTRVLSLRAFTGVVWADDRDRLPFPEFERAGGRSGLRGYSKLRFADTRQFVLTAEYLYRATEMVRGLVFVDWGSVASNFETLRPFDMDPSLGLGLDVGRRKRVSLQAAWSPEGIELSFGSDTLFSESSRREQ